MVSFLPGEADVVLHHLKLLLSNGVCPQDIAIIAPYNLQVLYAFSSICFLAYICVCLCMCARVRVEKLTYEVIFYVLFITRKKVVECFKFLINHGRSSLLANLTTDMMNCSSTCLIEVP